MWRDDANRGYYSDALPYYVSRERRSSPRIETPFPAAVRSVDIDDQFFEAYAVLDNFSSAGLYLRLARQVRQGSRLFVLIRLSIALDSSTACIALRGVAQRTDLRPGGIFGTAIKLTHHRFIACEIGTEWSQTPWARPVWQMPRSGHRRQEAGD
jgi:hypothetical protein